MEEPCSVEHSAETATIDLGFERPALEPYKKAWRLVEDWHTDCKWLLPEKITVKKGFITDGASIPRFLWSICGSPMDVPRVYAAIVHDWLYDHPVLVPEERDGLVVWVDCTRDKADALYRDFLIALGCGRLRAYTQWTAIRLFGWSHWHKES